MIEFNSITKGQKFQVFLLYRRFELATSRLTSYHSNHKRNAHFHMIMSRQVIDHTRTCLTICASCMRIHVSHVSSLFQELRLHDYFHTSHYHAFLFHINPSDTNYDFGMISCIASSNFDFFSFLTSLVVAFFCNSVFLTSRLY